MTIELHANLLDTMANKLTSLLGKLTGQDTTLKDLQSACKTISSDEIDLGGVITGIQNSSDSQKVQKQKIERLKGNVEAFIDKAEQIDSDVRDLINKRKDAFYKAHYNLKPYSEKGFFEKCWDNVKKVWQWCKEHWKEILIGVVVIAIGALSIVTFGTALPVLVIATVGATVGLASQLVSDIISFSLTGDWDGSWENYLGSALGGAVGGLTFALTRSANLACGVDGALSSFISGNLENMTGKSNYTNAELFKNAAVDGAVSATLSWGFGKATAKLNKTLSKSIPALSRLSGRGSYEASFKMALTKLRNNQIKNVTIKTFRNGVLSGLAGDILKNIYDGLHDGIRESKRERLTL